MLNRVHIPVTLEQIKQRLQETGYTSHIQAKTDQVYTTLLAKGNHYPLFIKIFQKSDLIQLITFIPPQIHPSAASDLARFLHLLNKEMDVPGFGMDEQSGMPFYRLMLPYLDEQIDTRLLDTYVKAVEMVLDQTAIPVTHVASGKTTYSMMVQKVQEAHEKTKHTG